MLALVEKLVEENEEDPVFYQAISNASPELKQFITKIINEDDKEDGCKHEETEGQKLYNLFEESFLQKLTNLNNIRRSTKKNRSIKDVTNEEK